MRQLLLWQGGLFPTKARLLGGEQAGEPLSPGDLQRPRRRGIPQADQAHQPLATAPALPGVQAGGARLAGQPAEALPAVVLLPQGGALQVQVVQRLDEMGKPIVDGVPQQLPVLLAALVPLPQLGQLKAHEVQLLPRVGHHVQVQRPGLGELPLVLPVHLLGNGCLAVDALVVGEGQQVALVVEVVHGEGELVVLPRPLVGRGLEVGQGVVHPANVPLVVKAQAALLGRRRHPRPGGGVLRRQNRRGMQRF